MDETARPPERDPPHAREPANGPGAKPRLSTHDPATGRPGRSYEGHTRDEALAIARNVRRAFEDWRRTSFAERGKLMKQAAAVLRRRQGEFAEIMTAEMGKILKDGRAEVEKCAFNCDHFADAAEKYLAREPVDLGGPKAFVTYNPLGVVLAVMPWNFPFWQVFRFAAPALMAGNGAVLKHASNVPGSALAIEAVFREAGFPAESLQDRARPEPRRAGADRGSGHRRGDPDRQRRGRAAGGRGGGRHAQESVLELGGSDAYLVLEDADIGKAAQVCAAARMVNAGQSCVAGKRFIVVKAVREAFERAFVDAMNAYAMSDPRDDGTKLGPLQSVAARDEVHKQVEASVAAGARLLTGGEVPDRPGAWYPATVLGGVRPGIPVYRGGGVRAGGGDHRSHRRGGRHPHRQRVAVRARLGRADARPRHGASASPPRSSRRASASSTATCAPTRACRSAASRIPATGANAPISASASSPTSRACSSRAEAQRQPVVLPAGQASVPPHPEVRGPKG